MIAGARGAGRVRRPFDTTSNQTMVVSLVAMDQGPDALGSAGPDTAERSRDLRALPTSCTCTMNTNTGIEAEFRRVPGYFVDTVVHELLHCLSFGFWQNLTDGTSDLIRVRSGATRAAYLPTVTRNGVTAPTLASVAYGDLLHTYANTEVPVTDDAGPSSDNAHWRIQVFRDEMKVHSGSADGPRTPTSLMTLGALRDLGWEVNFGAAEDYVMPQFRPDLSPIHRESAHAAHNPPMM